MGVPEASFSDASVPFAGSSGLLSHQGFACPVGGELFALAAGGTGFDAVGFRCAVASDPLFDQSELTFSLGLAHGVRESTAADPDW